MRPFSKLASLFSKKDSAMPSKFVYLSDEHYGETPALDILSPKQLDAVLSEGWTVLKRSKKTVTGPNNKKVTVEYLELGQEAKTRELAAPRRRDDDAPENYGMEERGLSTNAAGMRALSNPAGDNGSYLGNGSAFSQLIGSTPGVAVASNMAGDVAYGMGVDAAKLGFPASSCSLKPGSKPHEEWMKGYRAAGGKEQEAASKASLQEAYDLGKRAAGLPKDAEVSCPYPDGSALYTEWLRGFSENGGTVQ